VRQRGLARLLVVGWILRLILAPFTSWNYDDSVWASYSATGAYHLSLYSRPGFSYPPVWGHVLQALGQLLVSLGLQPSSFAKYTIGAAPLALPGNVSPYITSPWFNLAFKTILFAFDTGAGLVLYALVLHVCHNRRRARLAFALWFLNPYVIFESAVNGHFDSIVAFAVILAIFCVLTRRYELCGIAIALGTMTKLVPALLIPLVVVVIVRQAYDADRSRLLARSASGLVRFVTAGTVAALVIMVPDFVSGTTGTMISGTLARTSSAVQNIGGLALSELTFIRGLSTERIWFTQHPFVLRDFSDLCVVVVVAWTALRVLRSGASSAVVLSGAAAVLAVTFATEPLTQPQYLVWLLPAVVALFVIYGEARYELWVLSLGVVLFEVFIEGPVAFFAPVAAFTPLMTVNEWIGPIVAWKAPKLPGLFTTPAQAQATIGVVVAAVIAEVWLVLRGLRRPDTWAVRLAPSGTRPTGRVGDSATSRLAVQRSLRIPYGLVGTVLAVSLIVAGTVGAGHPEGRVEVLSASARDSTLSVRFLARLGPGDQSLRLVAFPISPSADAPRRVFVFYDPRYPSVLSTPGIPSSISQHLRAQFKVSRWDATVQTVDAGQLRDVLEDLHEADGSVIIDVSGVLPSSVLAPRYVTGKARIAGVLRTAKIELVGRNLITPWIRRGGVLIWGGAPIGSLTPSLGENTKYSNLARLGTVTLVGDAPPGCKASPVKHCRLIVENGVAPDQFAPIPTAMAAALGISYRRTDVPLDADAAILAGGRLLGWVGNGASSVTALSQGRGTVLIFGGQVLEFQDLSIDISLILISRAYASQGAPTWTTVSARRIDGADGHISWTAKLHEGRAGARGPVAVLAMDPDRWGTLIRSWVVSPGGSLSSKITS